MRTSGTTSLLIQSLHLEILDLNNNIYIISISDLQYWCYYTISTNCYRSNFKNSANCVFEDENSPEKIFVNSTAIDK